MSARISDDDLAFIATWCGEGYEGPEEDETVQQARRCAEWASSELLRRALAAHESRRIDATIAHYAAQGRTVTRAQARAALRREKAEARA